MHKKKSFGVELREGIRWKSPSKSLFLLNSIQRKMGKMHSSLILYHSEFPASNIYKDAFYYSNFTERAVFHTIFAGSSGLFENGLKEFYMHCLLLGVYLLNNF